MIFFANCFEKSVRRSGVVDFASEVAESKEKTRRAKAHAILMRRAQKEGSASLLAVASAVELDASHLRT